MFSPTVNWYVEKGHTVLFCFLTVVNVGSLLHKHPNLIINVECAWSQRGHDNNSGTTTGLDQVSNGEIQTAIYFSVRQSQCTLKGLNLVLNIVCPLNKGRIQCI